MSGQITYDRERRLYFTTYYFHGGGSTSRFFATEEECKNFIAEKVADSTKFWQERVAEARNRLDVLIIKGCYYTVGETSRPTQKRYSLGFGGTVWTVRRFSDGKVFETNNLWFGGKIPPEFLSHMPDNAEFL